MQCCTRLQRAVTSSTAVHCAVQCGATSSSGAQVQFSVDAATDARQWAQRVPAPRVRRRTMASVALWRTVTRRCVALRWRSVLRLYIVVQTRQPQWLSKSVDTTAATHAPIQPQTQPVQPMQPLWMQPQTMQPMQPQWVQPQWMQPQVVYSQIRSPLLPSTCTHSLALAPTDPLPPTAPQLLLLLTNPKP